MSTRFFLQNSGGGYRCSFDYDYEVTEWNPEAGATVTTTRDTDDPDHESCLKVVVSDPTLTSTYGKLDEVAQYKQAADRMDLGSGDLFVAFEIKKPDTPLHAVVIAKTTSISGAEGWGAYIINSGTPRAYIVDASLNAFYQSGGSAINDDTWHHVAFFFDRNSFAGCAAYIDGVEDNGTTNGEAALLAVGAENNAEILTIGAESDGGMPFRGCVRNVRLQVGGTMPTAGQVAFMAANPADNTASSWTPAGASWKGLWKLDDGDTDTDLTETVDGTYDFTLSGGDTTSFGDHSRWVDFTAAGVYRDIEDIEPETDYWVEFAYKCEAPQQITYVIYDQTNGANISTGTLMNTEWSNFNTKVTTPAGCTTIRLYLRASGDWKSVAFYIDDIVVEGNAIAREPNLSVAWKEVSNSNRTADGSMVVDRVGRYYNPTLQFENLTHSQWERLLQAALSDDPLLFDTQYVPANVDSGRLYTEVNYDFTGITNPSSTDLARYDASTSTQANRNDFETNEFTTGNYQAVDGDDTNYAETSASNVKEYVYHKFIFSVSSSDISAISEVKAFDLVYKGACIDSGDTGNHGFRVFLWDGTRWIRMGEAITEDQETVKFSVTDPDQARQFVDTTNGEVRVLIRSRAIKSSSGALTLRSYYISCDLNKNYDTRLNLTNKAVPSSDDVIYVKNLSDVETLANKALYRIGDDRESIELYKSLHLNGTTQYLTVSDDSSLDCLHNITVEAWICPDTTLPQSVGSLRAIAAKGRYDSQWAFYWYSGHADLNNPAPTLMASLVFSASGRKTKSCSNALTLGAWNHVVMTWCYGKTFKVYVNGSEVGDSGTTYSEALANTAEDVRIGYSGYNHHFFPGKTALVRVYDLRLTPTEITWLYNNPRASLSEINQYTGVLNPYGASNGDCVLYLDFDQGLTDLSDHGNDATATGSPTYSPLSGDYIEAKYNQYYKLRCSHFSENPLAYSTPATPTLAATMSLESLAKVRIV